jgi:hypothetical protein
MADLNFMFMILFVAVLTALGVANFVQAPTSQNTTSDRMIGLLYIIGAAGLIAYKIQSP